MTYFMHAQSSTHTGTHRDTHIPSTHPVLFTCTLLMVCVYMYVSYRQCLNLCVIMITCFDEKQLNKHLTVYTIVPSGILFFISKG